MSKDKLSISEIVELMVRNGNTTKKEAEEFVKVFLATIEDALLSGESVKVKGFGTFKSQWNEARRSVDVNTGNEIIIPGFYRVVFQPEADLRETINEPFAHLQTVVLPEEVGFEGKSDESELPGENDEEVSVNSQKADAGLSFFSAQAAEIKEILLDISALSGKSKKQSLDSDVEVTTLSPVSQEVNRSDASGEVVGTENRDVANDEYRSEFLDEDAYSFDDEEEEYATPEIVGVENTFDDAEEFDIVREVAVLYAEQQLPPAAEQIPPNQEKTTLVAVDDDNLSVVDSTHKEEANVSAVLKEDVNVTVSGIDQQPMEAQPVVQGKGTFATGAEEDDMLNEEPASSSIAEKPEMPYPEEDAPHEPGGEKSRLPVYLIAAALLLITGFAAYFLSPYFIQMRKEKKNQKRLEFIADSLATAKKVQQIKDSISSLHFVKPDTAAQADSLVEPEINLPVALSVASEQQPTVEAGSDENIYSKPRKYSETLATEKIVVGSQLTKLARRYYGHSYFWVYIYEANKDKISNPNNVPMGIEVRIPKVDARLVDPNNKESLNYALKLQSQYLK